MRKKKCVTENISDIVRENVICLIYSICSECEEEENECEQLNITDVSQNLDINLIFANIEIGQKKTLLISHMYQSLCFLPTKVIKIIDEN